jgi:hypothetical protein
VRTRSSTAGRQPSGNWVEAKGAAQEDHHRCRATTDDSISSAELITLEVYLVGALRRDQVGRPVGVKAGRPFAMVDWFATPYTEALHVVERYRLLNYETAKERRSRDAKENFQATMSPPARRCFVVIEKSYQFMPVLRRRVLECSTCRQTSGGNCGGGWSYRLASSGAFTCRESRRVD